VAGKTRKRVALELVVDLERVYARKKTANKELVALIKQTGTRLFGLHGIGPPPAPPGCWSRSVTSPGSRPRVTSRPGPAPPRLTPPPVTTSVTACPGAGTVRSTWLFT
jgi:hypothetical protein